MGKGRDKRKRAKDKKVLACPDAAGEEGGKRKESGFAKTQRKTVANEAKREQRLLDKEDDIDAALAALELENKSNRNNGGRERDSRYKICEELDESMSPSPSRSGFSMTPADASAGLKASNSFIIFGGERLECDVKDKNKSDEGKVRMFNDLHIFDCKKQRWKRINVPSSSPTPSPRSGHQSFFYRNCLYVFGGEYTSPNQNKFKHFKDLWRLNNYSALVDAGAQVLSNQSIVNDKTADIDSCYWERIDFSGGQCPCARSGHRITRIGAATFAMFGGYFDDNETVRYFNDLWLLDMEEIKWKCVTPGALKVRNGVVNVDLDSSRLWPSPRSGCQIAACIYTSKVGTISIAREKTTRLYVHGGYVKEREDEAFESKASRNGIRMESEDFDEAGKALSDTWYFDLTTMEWHKVKRQGFGPNARAGASMTVYSGGGNIERAILFGGVSDTEAKRGEVLVSEFFNEMYTFDLEKMRWSPFFVGEKRKVDYEKVKSKLQINSDSHESVLEKAATKIQAHYRGYRVRKAYHVYKLGGALSEMLYAPAEGLAPKRGSRPLGRIHAGLAAIGGILYIYGGVIEMGDTEITLDDLWMLDLKKANKWECINRPSVTEETLREAGAMSDSDEES